MCGRFALGIPKKRLEHVFAAQFQEPYVPHYNIAPGQEAFVVAGGDGGRFGVPRRWGLVPHWADDPKAGYRMINARSETVFDKPAFRDSIRTARCLVPVQAFYEWKNTEEGKQPHAIGVDGCDVFAMAGIMARWQDGKTGEVVESFSVLTCAPNELVRRIHDRMPVIIAPTDWDHWLDGDVQQSEKLEPLLRPYPAMAMCSWPVSTVVNTVVHDGPDLLKRVEIMTQGRLF